MPKRTFLESLSITAKGLAMGAADVVPGVSGGTIAFISGIYEELIATIHNLDFGFFKFWKQKGFLVAWNHYNLGFLLALFSGIAISILSLAKVITWLLQTYPILVWAFFFGLVIASIIYVGKQIKKFDLKIWIAILIATILSYGITTLDPVADTEHTWFLFLAGFIAIIAMILPGVSGAFILLLIGAYRTIIETLNQFIEGLGKMDWQLISNAIIKIGVFGLGAIVGLKIFSRVLNWMFAHQKNTTLAVLTGFMIGALNKIWPWKEVLQYRINRHGEEIPFIERSILPSSYEGEPTILLAIVFIVLGFATIFLLEYTAKNKTGKTP